MISYAQTHVVLKQLFYVQTPFAEQVVSIMSSEPSLNKKR